MITSSASDEELDNTPLSTLVKTVAKKLTMESYAANTEACKSLAQQLSRVIVNHNFHVRQQTIAGKKAKGLAVG